MTAVKKQRIRSVDLDKNRRRLTKNLNSTVKSFKSDLESMMESIQSISHWSNALQDTNSLGLVNEIFMDAYMSVNFSSMGLYKYANTALRSALENSLNWVYFSNHPIEFGWWKNGEEWFLGIGGHPWGRGYDYFKLLIADTRADPIFDKGKSSTSVAGIYSELSKSSHSNSLKMQTSVEELSPTYDPKRFLEFRDTIRNVLSLVNAIMILAFQKEFKKMNQHDKRGVTSTLLVEHETLLKTIGAL